MPLIGWAKPVPVNVERLRHQRRDYVLVAAAGPASNLVLAVAAALALALLPVSPVTLGEPNVSAPLASLLSAGDAAQRAARGVQHDSDSAARRRQRARRAAAAQRWRGASIASSARTASSCCTR